MTTDKTKSQNPTITNQPQAGPENYPSISWKA